MVMYNTDMYKNTVIKSANSYIKNCNQLLKFDFEI